MDPGRRAAIRVSGIRCPNSLGFLALGAQQFGPFQGLKDSTHGLHARAQMALFWLGVNGFLSVLHRR